MNLKLKIFLFLITILILPIYSQAPSLLRSTLGTGGTTEVLSSSGRKIIFPQSIGQTSVIGVFRAKDIELRQGFIQPFGKVQYKKYEAENKNVTVWPNPFKDRVFIRMNKELAGFADIVITDIAGRIVYAERISADEMASINLGSLSSGMYFITIRKDILQYNCKIIKD